MKKYIKNYKTLSFLLFIILILLSTFSITIGSVSLKSLDVWKIIINKSFNYNFFDIVWEESSEIIEIGRAHV